WMWTRLGDICFTTSGGTPSRKNKNFFGGNIPWLKSGELNNGIIKSAEESITEDAIKNSSAKIITKGTLLIALYGATVGKLGILGIDSAINQAVCAISTKNSIDQKFLFWYLSSYRNELLKARVGGAQPNISQQIVNDVQIPLSPLPEQRAIVSKIEQLFSDLDNGIENFKKAQAQLKLYRQSVLKAACEGKLVPTEAELARAEGREYEHADVLLARILKERREKWNGKGKYKEAEALETGELPELPEGWCWVNLEQLKSFSLYGPRYSSDDYANDGYIVLRTSDISESGKVDVSSAPCLNISKDDFSKYKVELGDLLITRTGSLGTLAVFNDNIESIPGAYLIMYRLVMNLGISWYIFYFLKSPLGQKHLIAGGAGVGRPNLNAPTIEVIPIPFPPHSEQRRIIAEVERRLSVSDKMEATIAESLRQSILKKAFEGKLLNERELEEARKAPDWEPAEKLVERIKAEKVKAQKNKHMSGE
ncbi:MAG: restriction endonuclease subunit S, partial [Candidatus Methanoperedens sp.]|nr:restriction endonuclease subunit S [Candidatus Methanoperedens sp.]